MNDPTPEQLALLSTTERVGLHLADLRVRYAGRAAELWQSTALSALLRFCGGRRIHAHGLEHLAGYTNRDSLLMAANHRSFFDFFVISAVLLWKTQLARRQFFPVRSDFFYDSPLGIGVNLVMSGMTMFPPVVREPSRSAFNRYSLERCVAELQSGGTIVGVHPEGRRNKSDDAYAFLPARPGVGKVALEACVPVIPVFVYGMSNNMVREARLNWTRPHAHPIDVLFGAPVDLEDLRREGSRPVTQKRASDRCLDGIRNLAARHRALSTPGVQAEKL